MRVLFLWVCVWWCVVCTGCCLRVVGGGCGVVWLRGACQRGAADGLLTSCVVGGVGGVKWWVASFFVVPWFGLFMGLFVVFMESLILAQDERWRRA